jgi:hypothetical protein
MSLKTDYLDGANGFTTQMATVFAAGETFVTANLAALTTGLQTAAAKGLKSFTVNVITAQNPANLRLGVTYLNTYLAGISSALLQEEIYNYEVVLSLNTSDLNTTSIDFKFSF